MSNKLDQLRNMGAVSPYHFPVVDSAVMEGSDLLAAIALRRKVGREMSDADLLDWKMARGNFGFESKKRQYQWFAWAKEVRELSKSL